MISGVDTRYDLGDDEPRVGRLVADRDLTIDGVATRLYSLMHDGRALLIAGDDAPSGELRPAPARMRVARVAGSGSMLIRPDGCIAWAGRPDGLRTAVERWFPAAG